ncbi:histidinol phosphate phosphatase H [Globomyces pollinis-pini]|nr:histidinol phosphate phosphatase H [Globomyces pollinis-pini]
MISCHSHSGQYCLHAHGTLDDTIKEAFRKGFVVYGLTEHMPRTRKQDLYPEESHLVPNDTSTQFDKFYHHAKQIQMEAPNTTKILVGMEIEWIHDQTFAELTSLQSKYSLDYLVGSIHHVDEVPIDFDLKTFESLEAQLGIELVYQRYFDAQYDMLVKVKPMVIGHFDLIRMWKPNTVISSECWKLIERNIQEIVSYGGLVEINSRGLKKNLSTPYPLPDILEIMIRKGVNFTLSDDAHGPNDVGMHYDKLYKYLSDHRITTVFTPKLGGGIDKYSVQELFKKYDCI